jgi:3-phosphoshikimate 1-carboxyvinyltransferase
VGLHNLPLKETDRLAACAGAIADLGGECAYLDGLFTLEAWRPPLKAESVPVLDTFGDHRMAMSLAPLSLIMSGLRIADPEVVAKSYPNYWSHLEMAGFGLQRPDH